MRTSMKIASGVLAEVVDPITAKYDAILATNPTVPVLFELAEYRGQQVLFTDAAATDPVTEVGDPIGGVRHPVTGEIIAVQTTDADRPEWGGFEVGAVLNGTSQYMSFAAKSLTNFLHQQDSSMIFEGAHTPSNDTLQVIVGNNGASSANQGVSWSFEERAFRVRRIRVLVSDGGGGATLAYNAETGNNVSPDGAGVSGISYGGTDDIRIFTNGLLMTSIGNQNELDFTGDSTFTTGIGSVRGDVWLFGLDGNVKNLLLYDRQLTDNEHGDISGLLMEGS